MTTTIEDAVNLLKRGISTARAAQKREFANDQRVVVRYTTWSRGRELRTWKPGVITAGLWNGRSWVYQVQYVDPRGHRTVSIVGRGNIRAL